MVAIVKVPIARADVGMSFHTSVPGSPLILALGNESYLYPRFRWEIFSDQNQTGYEMSYLDKRITGTFTGFHHVVSGELNSSGWHWLRFKINGQESEYYVRVLREPITGTDIDDVIAGKINRVGQAEAYLAIVQAFGAGMVGLAVMLYWMHGYVKRRKEEGGAEQL